ncbi:MAG TPA: Hsp20/alpha crystallin family protein [Casimicrobiaceae bacterium]|nr:Hsp20/alpha crystallin family protein [Casimicrobiaceae bacterium]
MTRVQIYDPFADSAVDTLLRSFFRPVPAERDAPRSIRIDVSENDTAYIVHADMPGVSKEDIQVAIEGNQVSITAEVKAAAEPAEGARVLRSERQSGRYFRSFTLPLELDETTSSAKFDRGVLELTLCKKPVATARKLTIQ